MKDFTINAEVSVSLDEVIDQLLREEFDALCEAMIDTNIDKMVRSLLVLKGNEDEIIFRIIEKSGQKVVLQKFKDICSAQTFVNAITQQHYSLEEVKQLKNYFTELETTLSPKILKVKIVTSSSPLNWYSGKIGHEFVVVDEGIYYKITDETNRLLLKTDCEAIV